MGGTTGVVEPTTAASATTTDGSSSEEGEASSGAEPVGLMGRGLLVRYFIDEAASGQRVDSLADAAPDPLELPISYAGGQPEFVESGGNRGLEWATESGEGMAISPVAGTKIESTLDGAATATIEVVVDPDAVGEPGYTTRFVHIGGSFATGRLVLGATTTQGFVLRLNDATVTEWATPIGALGRSVVHLVVDASQAALEDRARLFIDGVEQAATVSSGPGAGETITLPGGESLVLGNEPNSFRSMDGTLFYAAIYDVALDETEITTNAALLLASDDTQP